MKKKILTLCLVIALAATAVIGGTLAYFTDTEQTTNEMTVGNIDINLEEVKLVVDDEGNQTWVDYDQDDPLNLFPVKWEDRAEYGMSNNKAARVYNTSSSGKNAYLRTIVAIPSVLDDVIGLGFAEGEAWNATGSDGVKRYGCTWEKIGSATFDGYSHDIYVCDTVGDVAVEKGNYMLSLVSVWMYDTVTNEKLDALVKAEGNGVTLDENNMIDFDVKVLSQGVQTEGFANYDEAMASFGDVLTNVGDWFTGTNKAADAVINDWVNKN